MTTAPARCGSWATTKRSASLEAPLEGNAYTSDKPHVPTNLYEARDLFGASDVVREAFGQEVVDHYLNRANIELAALESTVTDWERVRGFERL